MPPFSACSDDGLFRVCFVILSISTRLNFDFCRNGTLLSRFYFCVNNKQLFGEKQPNLIHYLLIVLSSISNIPTLFCLVDFCHHPVPTRLAPELFLPSTLTQPPTFIHIQSRQVTLVSNEGEIEANRSRIEKKVRKTRKVTMRFSSLLIPASAASAAVIGRQSSTSASAKLLIGQPWAISLADYDGKEFKIVANKTEEGTSPSWMAVKEPNLLYAVDENSNFTRLYNVSRSLPPSQLTLP